MTRYQDYINGLDISKLAFYLLADSQQMCDCCAACDFCNENAALDSNFDLNLICSERMELFLKEEI